MVERVVSVNYFGRLKLHGKGSLKSQMWMTLAQTKRFADISARFCAQ